MNKRLKRRPAVVRHPQQLLDYVASAGTLFAEKSICPALIHNSLTALFSSMISTQ